MKSFTYSEARQNLSKLLTLAQSEDVEIRRRDGSTFILKAKRTGQDSPLDVPGIKASATISDIVESVRVSRAR